MFPVHKKAGHFGAEIIQSLLEIGRAVSPPARFHPGLERALEILDHHHDVQRSAIVVRRRGATEPCFEAFHGLTADERHKLLRQNTFLNVPLTVDRETSGALLVDLRHRGERDHDLTLAILDLVAFIIGQALRGYSESAPGLAEVRQRFQFPHLIGSSGPMQEIFEQISSVMRSNAAVMIRGESGTGKESIARAIHDNSPRQIRPFVKVSCASLPDTLIESELFGFEKGAFTGAHSAKKGRFELAEGGTLFLDEIGDLNGTTALKLLRVLQEHEFERLGGTRTLKTDARVIVATNKDLERAIEAGSFREDLYYTLNAFTIFVPPLRERKSDILLLADHFLEAFNRAHGKQVRRISTPAIDMLTRYHWPGNVRELSNAIERAVLLCDDHVLHGFHLPPTVQTAEASGTVFNGSLKVSIESYERELIHDTLKTTRGNRARAAKLLRTTERVINYKARKYGIDCERLK